MKLFQTLLIAISALSVTCFCPVSRRHQGSLTTCTARLNMADTATPSTEEQTYVKCGRCQTAYIVNEEDLGGANGKGRYVIFF